ncbi:hypothetical protein B0H14DRAFT_2613374 [Mycena olivaceomarginata]|nr:hypothetical protein B0H14DRAFT_2613374 [Mycena olivaceomarginata]
MACPLHPGWSASEDRAIKLEAILSGGVATTGGVKGGKGGRHGCEATVRHRELYTRTAARKARHDHVVKLRQSRVTRKLCLLEYCRLLHHRDAAPTSIILLGGLCREKTALKLIESLANNNHLPRMIRSLIFGDSFATQVISTQWMAVLVAMTNLERLVICRTIPLPPDILPSITFQLKLFGCAGSVVGPWTEFVRSQTAVEELLFDSDFFGPAPGPALLP